MGRIRTVSYTHLPVIVGRNSFIKENTIIGPNCVIAVSYTHLDVYKRQFMARDRQK